MGKRIGGTSISIAQLRDGYSYTEVRLYSAEKREAYPLTLLYNFTTGALLSGVDGKTLTECLNGWSQEPGTGRYCTIASARTTGTIAEILTNAWCEQFLTAEDGETVTTVTLYTRSKNTPTLPTSALVYNFSTGEITGDGKGDWRTSMEEFEGATAYALWSTSAIATRKGTVQTDTINASEWSTPKKIAENGTSPVEMYLDLYSWIFPADGDGFVAMSEYLKFSTDVLLVQGGEAIPFTLSVGTTGITGIETDGVTVKTTEDTVMLGDSASIRITAKYDDGGTVSRTVSLAKARAGQPAILYFAWSSSETEFLPQPIPRFYSNGRLYSNTKLIAGVPAGVRWIFSKEDVSKFKTDVYKYLWCKTTWNGTPFLFTGYTGKDGLNGACTLYQYGLGDDQGNEPTTWYDTMEELFEAEGSLFNSGKFLWMRSQFVPAGGSPSPAGWGAPVIAGSDSSEVYARIEENKTSIATIVKTGGTIDQRITEYDNTTGVSTRSQIEQTANKIALRVDGTNIKTPGGIVVGIVEDESVIKLEADKIIASGTLSADKFTSDMAIISDLQISDGGSSVGKIRSAGYVKNTYSKDNAETGFYMDNEGHLEATNAFFKNAQTYNLTMVGGEILGENNPLNTLVSSSGEASFKNVSSNPIYVKGSDLFSLIANNCPKVDNVTQAMIDAGSGGVLWLGSTKYPYVAFVSGSEVALSEETISWTTSTASVSKYYVITCVHTFTFTAPCPGTYYFDYTPPAILANLGGVYVLNNVQYKLDDGNLVYHRKSLGDSTSLPSTLSVYVSAAGSHTLYVEHESSEYALISYRNLDYTAKISYNQSGGLLAFISVNESLFLGTVTFTDSYHDAYYSYGSVTSSSLTKYSPFTGIQRSTGGSYSYYSVSGAISAKNLVLNGISKGEASVVYNLDSIYIYKDGATILSFGPNDYLSSANYPSFSFSALDSSKGVYVDDLFVKVDSSGNYKGSGDIGSGSRPFHYAYIDSLLGKTANLSGSLQVSSVNADSVSADSVSADSVSVGANGFVQIKERLTYSYIELYNEVDEGNPIRWRIEASSGNLSIKKNDKFNVFLNDSGLYGVLFRDVKLLDTVTSTGTYNLAASVTKYQFIMVVCCYGNDGAGGKSCSTFFAQDWSAFDSDPERLIVSSDSKYVAFYFSSDTQIVINSKNDSFELSIYGLY